MAEVLQIANRVLPLSLAANIQVGLLIRLTQHHVLNLSVHKLVPRAFGLASDYSQGENRIVGTLAFSAIDSFNRNQSRLQPASPKSSRPRYD
jgi:large subunit ribosomal protein L17e